MIIPLGSLGGEEREGGGGEEDRGFTRVKGGGMSTHAVCAGPFLSHFKGVTSSLARSGKESEAAELSRVPRGPPDPEGLGSAACQLVLEITFIAKFPSDFHG